jgi:hypothetical protein
MFMEDLSCGSYDQYYGKNCNSTGVTQLVQLDQREQEKMDTKLSDYSLLSPTYIKNSSSVKVKSNRLIDELFELEKKAKEKYRSLREKRGVAKPKTEPRAGSLPI